MVLVCQGYSPPLGAGPLTADSGVCPLSSAQGGMWQVTKEPARPAPGHRAHRAKAGRKPRGVSAGVISEMGTRGSPYFSRWQGGRRGVGGGRGVNRRPMMKSLEGEAEMMAAECYHYGIPEAS